MKTLRSLQDLPVTEEMKIQQAVVDCEARILKKIQDAPRGSRIWVEATVRQWVSPAIVEGVLANKKIRALDVLDRM